MPFTLAHPAIVLPLTYLPKKWFSLTGLVIGSLTPDFEYFIRMRIQSDYSHTWIGVLWFDIPIGLFLAFIYHNIVREKLIDNTPNLIYSRLEKFKSFDWNSYFQRHWFVIILSLFIGAASHLIWDSFTHDHGYFVQKFEALVSGQELFGRVIPTFKFLQHGSTLIGILVIAYSLLKLDQTKTTKRTVELKYWLTLALIVILIISARLIFGLDFKLYGHLIATGLSGLIIGLILTPILTRKNKTTAGNKG